MGPRGPGPSKKVSAPPQLNSTGIVLATHKERSKKKNNFSKIKSFSLVLKKTPKSLLSYYSKKQAHVTYLINSSLVTTK